MIKQFEVKKRKSEHKPFSLTAANHSRRFFVSVTVDHIKLFPA